MIKIVGKTEDNKVVVAGLFKLYDTSGLPLPIIFDLCQEKNWIPSFLDFYLEATKAGWKEKTILLRLEEALIDIYGIEFSENVLKRLKKLINK